MGNGKLSPRKTREILGWTADAGRFGVDAVLVEEREGLRHRRSKATVHWAILGRE
jgi:hypothetical protein